MDSGKTRNSFDKRRIGYLIIKGMFCSCLLKLLGIIIMQNQCS